MSLIANAAASAGLPTLRFHVHGGHKTNANSQSGTGSTATGSSQAPATTQNLLNSLLNSLEQTVGTPAITTTSVTAASAAVTGTAGAASAAPGAPTASSRAQEIQGFMHSLFQALKADGLGSTAAPAGSPSPASSITAAGLQTLIQHVGASGSARGATADLSASFNHLIQGAGGSASAGSVAAGSSTASNQSSNAGLQDFLKNLLQNVQAKGGLSFSSLGTHINANI